MDALDRRSKLTWREIKELPRDGLGFEAIPGGSIRAGLPASVSGQTILCFRIADAGRFLGFREGHTFHLVWIDFKFTLYPH